MKPFTYSLTLLSVPPVEISGLGLKTRGGVLLRSLHVCLRGRQKTIMASLCLCRCIGFFLPRFSRNRGTFSGTLREIYLHFDCKKIPAGLAEPLEMEMSSKSIDV